MNIFQNTATGRQGSNLFNLSHEHKLTMPMGKLVPFFTQEVVPGDRFKVNSEVFMRLAPTLAPIMHRVNVTTHYWYVPNRIVWDNWKDFITGGEDGLATPSHPVIKVETSNEGIVAKGNLADYMGIPTAQSVPASMGLTANALPFRAYQKIYNEIYRDQNLQDKINIQTDLDGEVTNPLTLTTMRDRNWEKDYYTSALPFAQKGSPVSAPIQMEYLNPAQWLNISGDQTAVEGNLQTDAQGQLQNDGIGGGLGSLENIDPELTGIDINTLREAVRLQEWLEKNARAGSRYVESIMAHFGERVPDYTAQRPVFLGGGSQPLTISEVLQTSGTANDANGYSPTPLGEMAGHGVSVGKSNTFNSRFTEHGWIIGIISVMPRTAYQQGLDRKYQYRDKFDYYWPEFAQLGEQEVSQGEVFWDYVNGSNGDVFGYQARYNHLKYAPSKVSGDFRDNLAYWHMGRIFENRPLLNDEFVTCNPRTDIFAVQDGTHPLYVQVYNNVKAIRKMPYHNVPTL